MSKLPLIIFRKSLATCQSTVCAVHVVRRPVWSGPMSHVSFTRQCLEDTAEVIILRAFEINATTLKARIAHRDQTK